MYPILTLSLVLLAVSHSAVASVSPGFRPIDLSAATNMAFADDVANDRKGGWTDQGPVNDMRHIPTGIQRWGGVPFNIIDPSQNSTNTSCIVLRGTPRPWLPLETPAIPVHSKAEAIFFIGACAWDASFNEDVLRMVVTYVEDLRYSESAFAFGREFGGWWSPRNLPLGDVTYERPNGAATVGLYQFGWINPYPEKTIADIKFISSNTTAIPIIVAATLVLPGYPSTDALVENLNLRQQQANAQTTPITEAQLTLEADAPKLRHIPAALVSVGNGTSTAPNYAAPSRILLSTGHGNTTRNNLPPKPFYRIQTHIAEPSVAEGVWDFTQLDRIIEAARSFGAEPMICISFPPEWFFANAATYADAIRLRKPYDLDAYAKYCADLVSHYTSGKWQDNPVLWWEFGNEVELHDWSYAYYIKVYQAVVPELRKVHPQLRIGGPATAGPNLGWASELLQTLLPQVDFISYHQYGYSEPFDSPDSYIMGRTKEYGDIAKRYRTLATQQSPGRYLPIIITEANTSWRYHDGTDPRIRSQFGAAWTSSILGHFIANGGDVLCYFTLNGGFGSIWEVRGKTTVFPVWHALLLFREHMRGDLSQVTSSSETIEAYSAIQDDGKQTVIIINKNNYPIDTTLSLGWRTQSGNLPQARALILNDDTYRGIQYVDVATGTVPTLQPVTQSWRVSATTQSVPETVLSFPMQAYEVRVILISLND